MRGPLGPRVPFWTRVDKSAGPDACWPWMGCRVRGYGQTTRDGQKVYTHRVALEEALGRPLAAGHMALHHCDNPPCVNPAHLYEGTGKDNSADMYARGRAHFNIGCARPDVTLRHAGDLRARGITPAAETTDELAAWRRESAVSAAYDLDRFVERIAHGDRLPELVA